jgi:pyridoxamine 5'-phosphate oxidase-like protein
VRALPWPEFAAQAPELAERGAVMLRGFTLGYLATLRPDGSPRIHPVTITIDSTGLYFYAVATTPKGRDLRRDPRYAMHAFPRFEGSEFHDDEFSFGGSAAEISDPALYADVATRHNDEIHPGDGMFRLDLEWALHKRRERDRGAVYLRWRAW